MRKKAEKPTGCIVRLVLETDDSIMSLDLREANKVGQILVGLTMGFSAAGYRYAEGTPGPYPSAPKRPPQIAYMAPVQVPVPRKPDGDDEAPQG